MGCHDVLVWTALMPHPRVSCCNNLFKIKYFPDTTSADMWASCLTLINKNESESHVWCIFSEGRALSNPRKLRSLEVWIMSPLPSERAGSSHQLSHFYPLKQKYHGENCRTKNQWWWAWDKHLDLSRVMSLEFGTVKLCGFCPTNTNGSRWRKGHWCDSIKETFPGNSAVNGQLFCAATGELEGHL